MNLCVFDQDFIGFALKNENCLLLDPENILTACSVSDQKLAVFIWVPLPAFFSGSATFVFSQSLSTWSLLLSRFFISDTLFVELILELSTFGNYCSLKGALNRLIFIYGSPKSLIFLALMRFRHF